MRKPWYAVLVLALMAVSFVAGRWYWHTASTPNTISNAHKILYYACPMHPGIRSDKPGAAACCGMELQPVYEDGKIGNVPGGTVQIPPQSQQLIGVRVAEAKQTSGTHDLRILGRVAVDENRIYRLNAAMDGWIQEIMPATVGSLVKKDESLATYYSPEFLGPLQAYFYALGAMDRYQASGQEPPAQIALTRANVQQAIDSLKNLGMGDIQIEELKRTRQLTQRIALRAPSAGFVIARNVSPGLRFERGTELYRIADLSRVWILADVFGREARQMRPEMAVRVSVPDQGVALAARVSNILPQFDPATRTLKVRLEADNPGYQLRPEMFVDVEYPIHLPPTLTVPADAVIDTGLRKRVFVDRGKGLFEPREVETGWRFGDRIQIVKGLMEGERIVVSGNFLVDSESRLKLAAAGLPEDHAVDPVCGMGVDPRTATLKSEHKGRTYYFCSAQCKGKFDAGPSSFAQGIGDGDRGMGSERQ